MYLYYIAWYPWQSSLPPIQFYTTRDKVIENHALSKRAGQEAIEVHITEYDNHLLDIILLLNFTTCSIYYTVYIIARVSTVSMEPVISFVLISIMYVGTYM